MLFNEAYYQYYPELVRYGRQLQIDESDVEDLVQETFMRLHVEQGKKVVFENIRAWLYKVLHNLAVTRIKAENLHHSKIEYYKKSDAGNDTLEELANRERRELVFKVLEQMPANEKDLLLLYHNGLKYKEIAEVLNINPKSVGTMLVRAISKLKILLKTEYHELF